MRNSMRVAPARLLLLVAPAAFYVGRGVAAQKGRTCTIENCVNPFDSRKVERTGAGYRYWFADRELTDGRTLKLSAVEPDKATHMPHRHPDDELFFVLKGRAELYLDGKTGIIGSSTSLYCLSNQGRAVRNVGDTTLKRLVMKKYEK